MVLVFLMFIFKSCDVFLLLSVDHMQKIETKKDLYQRIGLVFGHWYFYYKKKNFVKIFIPINLQIILTIGKEKDQIDFLCVTFSLPYFFLYVAIPLFVLQKVSCKYF